MVLIRKDLLSLQQQLAKDQAIVSKIKAKLQQNKCQSSFELESLINRLLNKYDKITARVKQDFRQELSIFTLIKGSFAVLFRTKKSAPSWMDELKQSCETELKAALGEISQDGIKHFVGGIRRLLQSLDRTPIQYSKSSLYLGFREFSKAEISLTEYPKK